MILSDIPQHREILDAMPNCGITFPLHDCETLKLCLTQYLNAPFADTGIELSLSPFTMKKMGQLYKKYYEGIK